MKKAVIGIACLLSLLAAPAAQAAPTLEPAPPPADVPPAWVGDDCPPLPPGENPSYWVCANMIFDAGHIRMGRLVQPLTEPIRVTFAFHGGVEPVILFGGLDAAPMKVAGLPSEFRITPEYGGHFVYATLTELSLRFRLTGPGLRQNCYLGTAVDFTMTPNGGFRLYPLGPNGEDTIGANYKETSFATPAATGCNGLAPVINSGLGLPSAAGENEASFRFYLTSVNYSRLP